MEDEQREVMLKRAHKWLRANCSPGTTEQWDAARLTDFALTELERLKAEVEQLKTQVEKDDGDEKHVHPLQLDVIERAVVMWSNPGEIVLTPFMGVGSEVYGALINNRRGVGIELKTSYFKQAKRNVAAALESPIEQDNLFTGSEDSDLAAELMAA